MAQILYSKDHEYVRIEGEEGVVGISEHAQQQLGDVVYVELPGAGKAVKAGAEAAVVESVKAASEVYAPVSGEVTATDVDGNSLLDNTLVVYATELSRRWDFAMQNVPLAVFGGKNTGLKGGTFLKITDGPLRPLPGTTTTTQSGASSTCSLARPTVSSNPATARPVITPTSGLRSSVSEMWRGGPSRSSSWSLLIRDRRTSTDG